MRLKRIEQLQLGALVKFICINDGVLNQPKRGFWVGIVYDIASDGTVHVSYDDGELCFYANDEEVWNENIYLLNEEVKLEL